MKKLVFILAVAVISLQSCNSSQAKSNGNESKSEGTPAETVSQNTGAEGGTVKLNKAKFLAEVWDYENSPKEWKFKGTKPAMIDFYADWCGPCKTAAPILEEISKEYAGKIIIYKVDTQVEQELAQVFGITGIPYFLYIPMKGLPTPTSGIARTKEDTKKMFQENINSILLSAAK